MTVLVIIIVLHVQTYRNAAVYIPQMPNFRKVDHQPYCFTLCARAGKLSAIQVLFDLVQTIAQQLADSVSQMSHKDTF